MVKVKKSNVVTLQKTDDYKNKQFIITVRPKHSGFESRMTLKVIGGGKNPRISAYGKTEDEAIYRLLLKVKESLTEYKKMELLNKDISLELYNAIINSMNILKIKNEDILKEVSSILQILSDDTIPEETAVHLINIKHSNNSKKSKDFETVALEWFNYKVSLTIPSEENVKPLSPKTLEGYNTSTMDKLIPHFKKNTNIATITETDIKNLFLSITGFTTKVNVHKAVKQIFDYAHNKGYIKILPSIKKPKKPYTDSEENISCIASNRQELWCDVFEKEDTDVCLLFETMLLEGCRPEEACGLKWKVLKEHTDELIINNAYKDICIFSSKGKIIRHERRDDRLKTPESYRTLPLNPRLKERLLRHKAKQQEMFEDLGIEWTEEQYIFLNKNRKPFVSEVLANNMRKIRSKYELEEIIPYSLRHSFATFCCENGMRELILMKLMGHTDFQTTQQYYVFVSSKMKQTEMAKVYKNHKTSLEQEEIPLEQKAV